MKQAGANPVKVTAIWEFEIVLSFVVIFMGKVDAILEPILLLILIFAI